MKVKKSVSAGSELIYLINAPRFHFEGKYGRDPCPKNLNK